jgi:hypothetical protein
MHTESSPLAGKTVTVHPVEPIQVLVDGAEFQVEDWWDTLTGGSWMFADGNPACLGYAMRSGFSGGKIPLDNEVLYGKVNGLGYLVHVSEIEE